MKKSTGFLLTLGISAIIIGGIGSAVSFNSLRLNAEKNTSENQYKLNSDSSELHLTIQGDMDITLIQEGQDTIRVSSTFSEFLMDTPKNTLKVTESKGKTEAIIGMKKSSTQKKNTFPFNFSSSNTTIMIPKNIKHVSLSSEHSGDISIPQFNGESLSLEVKHADISLNNIMSKTFDATLSSGDISMFDSIGKITLTTKNGDVFVGRVEGILDVTTNTGSIDIDGDSSMPKKLTAQSDIGDISIDGDVLPKEISAKTSTGDISIDYEKTLDNLFVDAKATLGDVSIPTNTVKSKDTADYVVHLKTDIGDISLHSYDIPEEEQ